MSQAKNARGSATEPNEARPLRQRDWRRDGPQPLTPAELVLGGATRTIPDTMTAPIIDVALKAYVMTPITRKDIIGALGEVDDIVVAEIVALGATEGELAEAQAWLANNEPLMNSGKSLPSGRVGQL